MPRLGSGLPRGRSGEGVVDVGRVVGGQLGGRAALAQRRERHGWNTAHPLRGAIPLPRILRRQDVRPGCRGAPGQVLPRDGRERIRIRPVGKAANLLDVGRQRDSCALRGAEDSVEIVIASSYRPALCGYHITRACRSTLVGTIGGLHMVGTITYCPRCRAATSCRPRQCAELADGPRFDGLSSGSPRSPQ